MVSNLVPLGSLKQLNDVTMRSLLSSAVPANGGFVVVYNCTATRADFAHGHARFEMVLTKHPFGTWKLDSLLVNEIQREEPVIGTP